MKTFRLSTVIFLLVLAKISFAQAPTASFTATANSITATAPAPLQGCEALFVTFKNTSPGATSLSWNFGNSQTKSGPVSDPTVDNPTVVYSAGTYTVTMTATNGSGTSSPITMIVTAFGNPKANFTASDSTICIGTVINFADTSIPGVPGNSPINSWTWSFSSGGVPNNSNSQNPTNIQFNTVGTFPVSLNVQDGNTCRGVITKNIVVQSVQASFSGSPLGACAPPLTSNFTNTSTGNSLTYSWNFGGGTPAAGSTTTSQNPAVNFFSSGTFPITLTVTDNFGCTSTAGPVNVTIAKPTAGFSAPNVCDGTIATFYDAAVGASGWTYTFSDPTSLDNVNSAFASPTHLFKGGPGVYSVQQVVSNSLGCKDTVTKNITIYPKPNAGFISDTLNACSPFTVTFTDTTTGATSWEWDTDYAGGALGVDGTTNPMVTNYNADGNYSVAMIATTANGCKDTVYKIDIIHILRPVANITSVTPLRGCFPLPVSASGATSTTGIGGPITNYHWDFGVSPMPTPVDTFNLAITTANYTYQDTGDWVITMVVTNAYGCKDTTTFTKVEVGDHVHFNFDADIKEGCFPMNENKFHYVNLDAPKFYADSIAWFYGAPGNYGPPPSCTNPIISGYVSTGKIPIGAGYLDPVYKFQNRSLDTGFIMLRVVVGFNGCNDTLTKPDFLYIHPPAVNFTASPTTICNYDNHTVTFTNTSKAVFSNTIWHWDFGDILTDHTGSDTTNTANATYTYNTPGIWTAWLFGVSRDSSRLTPYGPYGGPFSTGTMPGDVPGTNPYVFGMDTPSPTPPPFSNYNLLNYNILTCRDSFSTVINVSDFSASFTVNPAIEGCSPFPVTFTGNSADLIGPTGNATTWDWTFGPAGALGTGNPAYYTYTEPVTITYNTQLIATNGYGCKDTVYQNITVDAQPIANFATSDTTGCVPFTPTFTDLSTSNPGTTLTAWSWDFGDPNTTTDVSTLQGPVSWTYNNAATPAGATLPVTLTVTDSKNCVSNPFTFYVEPTLPVAGFTYPSQVCSGTQVIFDAGAAPGGNSNGIFPGSSFGVNLTYTWNFGDGVTVTDTTATTVPHTYNVTTSTTFTVTLTVKDKNGCTNSFPQTILISQPVADFTQNYTVAKCPPFFVDFYDLSTSDVGNPIISWQYNFGNGIFSPPYNLATDADTSSNPYTVPGIYGVTLTIMNSLGCSSTIFKDTLIHVGGPTVYFHYLPTSGFCAPGPVQFVIDSMKNVSSWVWAFGDFTQDTSGLNPITHIYQSGGTFLPAIQVTDTAGCQIPLVGTVPIVISGAILSFTADASILCGPSVVNFTNTTALNGVTATSYSWNFGPNANPQTYSGPNPPPISYSGTGSNDVTLTVTSSTAGCGPFTLTIPDMITGYIGPPLILTGNGASCPPLTVQFGIADTTNKGMSSFQWNFGTGATSLLNDLAPSYTYTNSGIFFPSLDVTFTNGCTYNYPAIPDTVYATPTADFTYAPIASGFLFDNFQFTNTSLNYITSQWNFGDSTGNFFVTNLAHKFTAEGNYPVQLVVSNSFGCFDSITKIINVDYELDVPNVITPNGDGVNDFFTIKLPTDNKCVTIDIYDRWGIRMYSSSDFKNDWKGTDDKGNKLNTDTYYYIVNYCESFTINGWVFVQN